MKILMHFNDYTHTPERIEQDTYGGIGYYRIIKPSEMVRGHDVTVIGKELVTRFGTTREEQWDNVFKEYDVFWTNYFCDPEAGAAMLFYAQKHGKKVIIDIDDNYLDIPESNLLYDRFKPGKRDRAFLSTILALADVITTSTYPLKDRLYEHFKTVHGLEKEIVVIPNLNELKDWAHKRIEPNPEKIVIGYSGSNSHQDDVQMVLPAIKNLMEKYPNLYFEMIGIMDKKTAIKTFKGWKKDLVDRVAMVGATPTFREYPQWLSERQWDIGIAPLVDTAFTNSKSSIKWLEYSVFGIPTVASRVYPYFVDVNGRETIKHDETGLLCRPQEWETNLEKVILDSTLRDKLGGNAFKAVEDNWQYFYSDLPKVIGDMLEKLNK